MIDNLTGICLRGFTIYQSLALQWVIQSLMFTNYDLIVNETETKREDETQY